MNKFLSITSKRAPAKQEGATAIEYGLIAGLIVLGIVIALGVIGTDLGTIFGNVQTQTTTAATAN